MQRAHETDKGRLVHRQHARSDDGRDRRGARRAVQQRALAEEVAGKEARTGLPRDAGLGGAELAALDDEEARVSLARALADDDGARGHGDGVQRVGHSVDLLARERA